MAKIEKLWRLNEYIGMPEDRNEIIIFGPFTIGVQSYSKAIVKKEEENIILSLYDSNENFYQIYSSSEGWLNYNIRIWDFGEGVTVLDYVFDFMNSQASPIDPVVSAVIRYDGKTLTSIGPGRTAELECIDYLMKTNLEVAAAPLCHKVIIPTKEVQEEITPEMYGGFHSFRVEPIPDEFIVPTGTASILENGEYVITPFEKVDVQVETPTEELKVTPIEEEQIFNPPAGKHYSTVTVERIPEDYLIPTEHLDIFENVENKDIREYATLTVDTMKAIRGQTYDCKAGTDIDMGTFVEFLVNYGHGEFLNKTVSNIKLHYVNQEKVLIEYEVNGHKEIIGLYLVGNLFQISKPITYGVENAETYDLTPLDSNTVVCLWTIKENISENQTLTKVFMQSIQILASAGDGIVLMPMSQLLVYSSDPGAEIEGAAIARFNYNSVFITMKIKSQDGEITNYSTIKTLNSIGGWNSGISGSTGYNFTNSNNVIGLSADRVLCTWLDGTTFKCGLITVDSAKSEMATYEVQSIEGVASFKIKDMHNYAFFPLLITTIDNNLEIRTLTIGGSSITLSEPIVITENVSGPSGVAPVTSYDSIVIYTDAEGHLLPKFFNHTSGVVQHPAAASPTLFELAAKDSLDIEQLAWSNNILAYTDAIGSSQYVSLQVSSSANGDYVVEVKNDEAATYVYPTTSNNAIVGVAVTNAKSGEDVRVVRPS